MVDMFPQTTKLRKPGKILIDMFPHTVKWVKMTVDMFPNTTEWDLTFLLFTRAIVKPVCCFVVRNRTAVNETEKSDL